MSGQVVRSLLAFTILFLIVGKTEKVTKFSS